ncbi:cysteine hydrolase family protein [Streptomyces malaysiense]|uniref:Cysteine hydrolase n=1 Tax=Streptomyces malaysiense TaxID=1428626 RepID=A0A1J4Q034_9ACTN|nr:cysteine hydrolase family protein [Streptomyces malaysiense]OIK25726.1 cysteine hydrolase [Streptomyces malaysiense]
MTTLQERPGTAVLVIDVQNGVVAGAPVLDDVLANINTLIDRARSAGVPVVWVQHQDEDLVAGTESWEYVSELKRLDTEPLVAKSYPDSFEDTALESVLAEHGVGRLLVTGAQTDCCVRSTLHGALVRGYDAVLVADAHTTEDLTAHGAPTPEQVIAHTNLYWSAQSAPGREAGTVKTADVTF